MVFGNPESVGVFQVPGSSRVPLCRVPHGSQCVMSGLIHTGLGSSSLIAHVLHSPPPPPANSFVIGPAVINTHLSILKDRFCFCKNNKRTIDRGQLCHRQNGSNFLEPTAAYFGSGTPALIARFSNKPPPRKAL
jgi:hypothetical protein